MKRLLCLFLTLLSLGFCSCEAVLDRFVDTAPGYLYDASYLSFEEMILDSEHIVEVKCIEKENDYYYQDERLRKSVEYTFVVTEVIYGTVEEGLRFSCSSSVPFEFHVNGYEANSALYYDFSTVSYQKGNKYIMLLNESGEAPDLSYSRYRDHFMPLNDLSKSTVYAGNPITEHTANPDAFSSKEALVAYMQEVVAQAPAESPSTD